MKNYVVFGCGRFGTAVATTLFELGYEVMAVDIDEEKVQSIADQVTTAIQCDVLDEKATDELGLSNFDAAIISIGENLEAAIISVLISKEAGLDEIIAKAPSERKGEILYRIGATKVLYPEMDMGHRLAYNLANKSILDIIQFSDKYSVAEIRVNKDWVGKTIGELDFRNRFGVTIIAIHGDEDEVRIDPSFGSVLKKDDQIIVLGHNDALARLEKNK